jgi:hypothetical protein
MTETFLTPNGSGNLHADKEQQQAQSWLIAPNHTTITC